MIGAVLDKQPVIVAIAGPNGAGKTTFLYSHLREAGLRFINADDIARELNLTAYDAAEVAGALRSELVSQRESFVFETVFSDPVGGKLSFLRDAAAAGYNVVLCFIGLSGPETSEERVAMRVTQGGHDVPSEKLTARFPRTLANLKAATPVEAARADDLCCDRVCPGAPRPGKERWQYRHARGVNSQL